MDRLVVGVDRSPSARAALAWAAHIADRCDAELVVVSAWQPGQAELPPEIAAEERRTLYEELDRLDASLGLPDDHRLRLRNRVIDGVPVDAILEAGSDEHADLVVVGLPGEPGSPARLGTVTDGVAHRTAGPLVVVPDTPALDVTRILLGLDGSHGAASAAQWCATFASVLGAEVVAAFVDTQQLELVPERDPTSAYQAFERALRSDWTAALRDRHVRLTTQIVHDPSRGDGLLHAADDAGADLIVVGTHRRNPLTHIRLGGTAMRLVHSTPRPLALVPPDRADRNGQTSRW